MILGAFLAPARSSPGYFIVTSTPCARRGSRVQCCALHLGALRDEPHHDPRDAGDRDHAAPRGDRAHAAHGSSIRRSRRSILFQHCSGSTRTRELHHDPAGMGVISELVTCFSRAASSGYRFIRVLECGDAGARFLVWGHHVRERQSEFASVTFSALTMLVAVRAPSRCSTGWRRWCTARSASTRRMLYSFGFIGLFTVGGIVYASVVLGATELRTCTQDGARAARTSGVGALPTFIMVGSTVWLSLGGCTAWWRRSPGAWYHEALGRSHRAHRDLRRFLPSVLSAVRARLLGMPRALHLPPSQLAQPAERAQLRRARRCLGAGYLNPDGLLPPFAPLGQCAPAPIPGARRARVACDVAATDRETSSREPVVTRPRTTTRSAEAAPNAA